MNRILFISQFLNRAGTEAFMMSVTRTLPKHGMIADFLLYSTEETDYSREVESMGGRVYRIRSRRQSPWRWYTDNYKFFRNHSGDYKAIHFCGNGLTAIAPIIAAWFYRIPIRICHAHSSSSEGWHNRFLHLLHRKLSYALCTDHLACSSLAAQWFFGNKPSLVIKNGIETERFKYDTHTREKIRSQLGLENNMPVLGHVGRMLPVKNHAMILRVFKSFLRIRPTAKLLLIGDGELRDNIQQQAAAMELSDNIFFLGERGDVNELMQAMDLFIMPSKFEGLPFVLIEAQCSGLPCVISDTINNDVALSDRVLLQSLSASPEEWAESVNQMMNLPRINGQNIIRKSGYDTSESIKQIIQIYNR